MQNSPKRSYAKYLMGGTGMAMLIAFAAPVAVQAQDAAADDVTEVVIVGARAAQQSAIQRQKRAKTPTESIVADDVGDFPDRNIAESISRISGTALSRDDYGEGNSVSIRGNGPDLTRVELDGMGVVNTSGNFAISGGDARGAGLNELPTDLIKSVDVVKGTTADMTEGSLGGGVIITSRSALDFKKPYISFRAGVQQNSLGERWTPNYNLIASRKFFDDRLGLLVNITGNNLQNNSHTMQTVTSGNRGYSRDIDYDNSPEKTFSFNPSTVSGDDADVLIANSLYTPRQLVERAASATSKDNCKELFPLLLGAESNARKDARIYEQITCLNQWNDYAPSLIRSFMKGTEDKRLSVDLRADFRVNDKLSVYAKVNQSNRKVDEYILNRNLGEVVMNNAIAWTDDTTVNPRVRSVNALAPDGWYLYDGVGRAAAGIAHIGHVVNVDPSSVEVDANHHLTKFTLGDSGAGIDEIDIIIDTKTSYAQFGGVYQDGPLKIEFMGARTQSEYSRDDMRTNRYAYFGRTTLSVTPGGLWSYELPATYDENDGSQFARLNQMPTITGETLGDVNAPSYVAPINQAQRVQRTHISAVTFEPRMQESEETSFKLDGTYDLTGKVPFFTQFKTGLQYRDGETRAWGAGVGSGLEVKSAEGTYHLLDANGVVVRDANNRPVLNPNYVAPVVVPTSNMRGFFYGCEETATSTESCNYGFQPGSLNTTSLTPNNVLLHANTGTNVMTQAQYAALINSTSRAPDSVFFGDYPDRGDLMTGWNGIDVRGLFSQLDAARNFNLDCMKECRANDGNVYAQPMKRFQETTLASYYMVDFEQDLPLSMVVNGNFGVRRVETEVKGTGILSLRSIRTLPGWSSAAPDSLVQSTYYRSPITLSKKTVDWLPSYNLNLWLRPDELVLRYYTSKTVSRPPADRLLPAGECTIDERKSPDFDESETSGQPNTCTRIGNPELKPFTAWNESLNLEWYPNRDTMFSLAYHRLDVRIGNPVGVTQMGTLLAGTGAVDPVTGESLENMQVEYATWANGSGYGRDGWEFSSKTAFTFLPWYLRYTGADFNYSKLASTGGATAVDPNTGDVMRPINESDYFANLSLWYDDGRVNARVSYQARAESFLCITACGANTVNNYPGNWGDPTPARPFPYNPGQPRFADETKYIDAKITYKINPNVEVFAEGRNMTRQARTISGGNYNAFAGGQTNLFDIAYGGRRVMLGFTYRN